MDPNNTSLFNKEIHPLKQAFFFVLGLSIVLGLVFLFQNGKEIYEESTLVWELSLSSLLMFAVFNSVMSLSYKNQNDYWFYSTIAFVLVAGVGIGLSYILADLNDKQFGIFKWLYLVFGIGYLIFLSIVRAMKRIVEIAQREDAKLRGED